MPDLFFRSSCRPCAWCSSIRIASHRSAGHGPPQALEYGPELGSSDEEEGGRGRGKGGDRHPKAYDAEQEELRKAFLSAVDVSQGTVHFNQWCSTSCGFGRWHRGKAWRVVALGWMDDCRLDGCQAQMRPEDHAERTQPEGLDRCVCSACINVARMIGFSFP